jgi:hypothetical protein
MNEVADNYKRETIIRDVQRCAGGALTNRSTLIWSEAVVYSRRETSMAELAPVKVDVGLVLDAIVGRLSYDDEFAAAAAKEPLAALTAAGMLLDKDSVEEFIRTYPARFDAICDKLTDLVAPEFLINLMQPSCG